MNFDRAYELIHTSQPALLYLTGKTCTGKTTFSQQIRDLHGYYIITLDDIVHEAVVRPLALQDRQGEVFVSVYRTGDPGEWTDRFLATGRSRIKSLLQGSKKVAVDGALANPDTVRRLFSDVSEVQMMYFHPVEHSAAYIRNLTSRFMGTTADFHNGLPSAFWGCISKEIFAKFCQDRRITPELQKSIEAYAPSVFGGITYSPKSFPRRFWRYACGRDLAVRLVL